MKACGLLLLVILALTGCTQGAPRESIPEPPAADSTAAPADTSTTVY